MSFDLSAAKPRIVLLPKGRSFIVAMMRLSWRAVRMFPEANSRLGMAIKSR